MRNDHPKIARDTLIQSNKKFEVIIIIINVYYYYSIIIIASRVLFIGRVFALIIVTKLR